MKKLIFLLVMVGCVSPTTPDRKTLIEELRTTIAALNSELGNFEADPDAPIWSEDR